MSEKIVWPEGIKAGDRIAIVSPASKIDGALIDGAAEQLRREGFDVVVGRHAKGVHGSLSGTAAERLEDLRAALEDDGVRCVLCSRGGYGAVHLLEDLDRLPAGKFNKWLVGFSDISALHALWGRKGVASLHGAMTKYLGRGEEFSQYFREMDILRGGSADHIWEGHAYNRYGTGRGRIVGGNMAVLGGLMGTKFSPMEEGCILLIEDVAEPIYKVERLLWQLKLQGYLGRLAGLIVGQFTEYRPGGDYTVMEDMIRDMTAEYNYPVAFGVPVGHIEDNEPVVVNADGVLTVDEQGVRLEYVR